MQSLKTVLKTLAITLVVVVLSGLGFVYSGVYNIAATDDHWPPVAWLLHVTMERSVALRADDIVVPPLDSRAMLLEGAASFDAMCSGCHTAPGAQATPVAKGLSPQPPDLAHAATEYSAAELFWITRHGVKMSGMPAWGPTHDDKQLWPVVAFVQALPGMDGARYQSLLEAARQAGVGHHAGKTTPERGDSPAADHDGNPRHHGGNHPH